MYVEEGNDSKQDVVEEQVLSSFQPVEEEIEFAGQEVREVSAEDLEKISSGNVLYVNEDGTVIAPEEAALLLMASEHTQVAIATEDEQTGEQLVIQTQDGEDITIVEEVNLDELSCKVGQDS